MESKKNTPELEEHKHEEVDDFDLDKAIDDILNTYQDEDDYDDDF